MQNILTHRNINLAGFLACVAMILYALYAQEFLNLAPCPLCIFQRVSVIIVGLFFLLAALQNPGPFGRRIYTGLITLSAVSGAGIAARHMWLQSLPPDQVPSCGPDLDFMLDTFPLLETLQMVFTGSGECAEISWVFLGLSMPAWVLIGLLGLSIYAIWGNLVSTR
ncbi:MAG: disulfide bond formation protein B [Gammaproteobacteria bacterium]|jgi:protein dithiol:quinone oxidoreductase|nr:disulfide bond formation protein B [Gammaproteobacteria bacterium]